MVASSFHLISHICVPNRFIIHVGNIWEVCGRLQTSPKINRQSKLTSFNFHPSQANIAPIDTLEILFCREVP